MTVKEIELQIIGHARSLATSEESLKNLRDNDLESKEATLELFGELKRSVIEIQTEAAERNLRLSLAEREIADIKLILERGRSFRWALTATSISVVLSSIFSALIAIYLKPN